MSKVVLHAVGDILPGAKPDGTLPFRHVLPVLRAADLVFGNLESPLSVRGQPAAGRSKHFRAPPDSVYDLRAAGFSVLNVANNHILDFGPLALADTLATLRGSGIQPLGAGLSAAEARQPVVLSCQGLRIAFLAYCSHSPAGRHSPGSQPFELEPMRADVMRVRAQADLVVVSCHIGLEYCPYPLPRHRETLHALVDAGADLVLGHHPHVLQGIERRGRGLIAYSLGNFLFASPGGPIRPEAARWQGQSVSEVRPEQLARSLILRCELTAEGVAEYDVIPVALDAAGHPELAAGAEAEAIREEVRRLSASLEGSGEVDLHALQDARLQSTVAGRLRHRPLALLGRLHRVRGRHVRALLDVFRQPVRIIRDRIRAGSLSETGQT